MRVVRSIARRFLKRTLAIVAAFSILILGADKLINYTAKMLYPNDYSVEVQKYCNAYGVNESLVFAVIKCESNFKPDAKSSAGAMGLMQLTPDTFNWVCKNIYDFEVDESLITDTATNIKCGVWLLSYLQKELSGEPEVIAAYNAGVNKVKDWLSEPMYSADGITLSSVPYKETENHIKKVLKAKEIYQKLYNLE